VPTLTTTHKDTTMNKLELLANDLALLSNDSLAKLATILVVDYPTRAEALENYISIEHRDRFMDHFEQDYLHNIV
jgi:hypothetical protein